MARTKQTPKKTVAKRPHRFKPGTRAKFDARKIQKLTKLIIPRSTFKRFVRDLTAGGKCTRLEHDAVILLQEAAESFMYRRANDVGVYLVSIKKKQATSKAIKTVQWIRREFTAELEADRPAPVTEQGEGKRHQRYVDPLYQIPKTSFRKFFLKGGVLRVTRAAREESRHLLKAFVNAIVGDALVYMEHCKRVTVTSEDICMSLSRNRRPIYG